jgi:DNA primase
MIDEIKSRIGILDLASRLGLKVNSSGFTFSIYKEEKSPSLKLYPKTNSFFDFSTNQGGDLIKLYQDYYNITTKEAIKELTEIFNLTGSSANSTINRSMEQPKELIPGNQDNSFNLLESEKEYFEERSAIIEHEGKYTRKQAEVYTYELIKQQREEIQKRIFNDLYSYCMLEGIEENSYNYLTGKERGLAKSTINFFKLFSIHSVKKTVEYLRSNFNKDELTISGLFTAKEFFVFTYHRIVIPYIENEEIKYLRGRYFYKGSSKPVNFGKYIGLSNTSNTLTSKRLFNIDILKQLSPYLQLVICEGEFDCMVFNQIGFNAVAIAGVGNFPKGLIPLLHNYDVYLCFDNDEAGKKAITEISSLFSKPIKQLKLKNYKDISELVNGTI